MGGASSLGMQRQAPSSVSGVDGVTDDSEPNIPAKNAKNQHADSNEADTAAASDADPGITLCVACVDGSSLDLKVPPRELVREVKRTIGQVRRRLETVLIFARCFDFHSRRPSHPFPIC